MAIINETGEEADRTGERALALLLAMKGTMNKVEAVETLCCALQIIHLVDDPTFRAEVRSAVRQLLGEMEKYERDRRGD